MHHPKVNWKRLLGHFKKKLKLFFIRRIISILILFYKDIFLAPRWFGVRLIVHPFLPECQFFSGATGIRPLQAWSRSDFEVWTYVNIFESTDFPIIIAIIHHDIRSRRLNVLPSHGHKLPANFHIQNFL